jgi:hypothetical protein
MSPCVRKDRKTLEEGGEIVGTSQTSWTYWKEKRCLRNKAFAWAYLVLDHPRVYCSTLRLAQPNTRLKLVKRNLNFCGVCKHVKESQTFGPRRQFYSSLNGIWTISVEVHSGIPFIRILGHASRNTLKFRFHNCGTVACNLLDVRTKNEFIFWFYI